MNKKTKYFYPIIILSFFLISMGFAQKFSILAEIGTNDFRITDFGPDGNSNFNGSPLGVAYNSTNNEYLVVMSGDDNTGTLVDNEFEVFGQRIDGATGAEVGTNDFRISDMGPDGDTSYVVFWADVAYNSTNNEYLVVWAAEDNTGGVVDGEVEIFGQRIDGATGAEVGTNDFRISDMGPDGNINYDANRCAVAYNSTNNEYLVVWHSDDNTGGVVDNEFEIFGQRLNAATGAEVGTNDFRISDAGSTDGVTTFNALDPRVAYNSTNNEYLVVWEADEDTGALVNGEFEIYGQRLNAATGAEVGTNDFRISDMGSTDGDNDFQAIDADVAYSTTTNEYFVVWSGDDDSGDLVNDESEIFGQRISGTSGAEVGDNDFRISDMGSSDGNRNFDAFRSRVDYDSISNQFLVVWHGDDDHGSLADDEFEIYVQQIDATTGNNAGTNDIRISDMGSDGDADSDALGPQLAFNLTNDEFLVVFLGDDNTGSLVNNEFEIYGQRFDSEPIPVEPSVSNVQIYPNPFRPALGHSSITFENLPSAATLMIHSLVGDLVKELTANSSGIATWDAKNTSGENAASGVYYVYIEGDINTIKKIAIQR